MLKLKYGLNLHSALEGKLKKRPVFVLLLRFAICVTAQPSKRMARVCMYTDVAIL
jgi:hypothetical protein